MRDGDPTLLTLVTFVVRRRRRRRSSFVVVVVVVCLFAFGFEAEVEVGEAERCSE